MSWIEDRLAAAPCPLEGTNFIEIVTNLSRPLTDDAFKLGLETNNQQMRSFVEDRRRMIPDYIFTDPTFPPDSRILVKSHPHNHIFWRRPHQMSSNPRLVQDGFSSNDVIQGEVGDCYFLSSCAAVARQPKLMEKVIPPGQTLDKRDPAYDGLVRFRFWRFGKWREVIVDDWLPTIDGESPYYSRSSDSNEFWISLFEKAYAKLVLLRHNYELSLYNGVCSQVARFL
ncbi:unnamed protein product [Clavelina lepadiformis]|uniref:Calpain catalytic domain-containing protein n=1 Tax=Clavelina lepadiformis TaxID=159417 RepID=A0ABP0GJ31_CLALP